MGSALICYSLLISVFFSRFCSTISLVFPKLPPWNSNPAACVCQSRTLFVNLRVNV